LITGEPIRGIDWPRPPVSESRDSELVEELKRKIEEQRRQISGMSNVLAQRQPLPQTRRGDVLESKLWEERRRVSGLMETLSEMRMDLEDMLHCTYEKCRCCNADMIVRDILIGTIDSALVSFKRPRETTREPATGSIWDTNRPGPDKNGET
jgi:hypothetical protein